MIFFILFSRNFFCQNQIPSSTRSKNIVDSVSTLLMEDLKIFNLKLGSSVYIRIFKESRELELWIKGDSIFQLYKIYPICTYGWGTLGPKLLEGDGQAPEGFYSVGPSFLNPYSSYHLSIGVGYPNDYDRSWGRTGSAIMIHGSCVSIGCFAMIDSTIERIYTLVYKAFQNSQSKLRIDIFPFRLTDIKHEQHNDSEWIDFWYNLKEGYDLFEKDKIPPKVRVRNKKYVFN